MSEQPQGQPVEPVEQPEPQQPQQPEPRPEPEQPQPDDDDDEREPVEQRTVVEQTVQSAPEG